MSQGTMRFETADYIAITRLQQAYADTIDVRDWARIPELFLPDTVVSLDLVTRPSMEIAGPEAFVEFVSGALQRYSFFQFVILNSHVDLYPDGDPDVATARLFFTEMRALVDTNERDDAFGLYRDTYRRVDGRWRIAARRYRSIARFPSGDVFPLDLD